MFLCGDGKEPKVKIPLIAQMKDLFGNYRTYYLSLWYFITFGALWHLVCFTELFSASFHYR